MIPAEQDEKLGHWGNVFGFDFSCVRKCVMEEPLVDVVEEATVATTSCCILVRKRNAWCFKGLWYSFLMMLQELDLNTCKKEDLDFCAPYCLELTRRDFVHGMVRRDTIVDWPHSFACVSQVLWFDITFTACHKPVTFSTSPSSPYTHWKQTVLYLDDVILGHEGGMMMRPSKFHTNLT